VVYGTGGPASSIGFAESLPLGSVRLTERFFHHDPPSAPERRALSEHLHTALARLPPAPEEATVVGLAATVTTAYLAVHGLSAEAVESAQGKWLHASEVDALADKLLSLTQSQRSALPGVDPRRAGVLPAGVALLAALMHRLGAPRVRVSDRGLRWGLLRDRFGT
jgi:exopolyphosphatase/guanosine-5'-triphosphate,3'-diphosphate pyrophosphatase